MTFNNHDFPADQDRIAAQAHDGFVDYFTPAPQHRGTGKGEPVDALDQIFLYYED